jgi:hypothetical protein
VDAALAQTLRVFSRQELRREKIRAFSAQVLRLRSAVLLSSMLQRVHALFAQHDSRPGPRGRPAIFL